MKNQFRAFDQGSDSLCIGDLTIEDAGTSVAIYGSLTIEATRQGLRQAEELAEIADAMVARLRAMDDLPETLPDANVTSRPNPFDE